MNNFIKYIFISSLHFINAQLLGGTKDEYGCIINAGYEWCEKEKKCIRPWEEGCNTVYCNDSLTYSCDLLCDEPICNIGECAMRYDNCCNYICKFENIQK